MTEAAGAVTTWREAPRPVKAIIAGVFVNRLGGFLQAFLVLYLVHEGYGAAPAGLALGANGAGAIVGILISGWLADRVGARRAIVGSMALTAALTAAVLAATTYPAVLLTVTLLGVASQIYRPVSAELVSARIPPQRQVMVFAMYRLALNLGTTAAPLLGAGLAAVSYPLLFWGEAVAALACAALCLWALPPDPSARAAVRERRSGYAPMLRDLRYLGFLAGMLIYAAVYIQYVAVLPLAVRDAGWSISVYGALVSLNGAVVIACELLITSKAQHWPQRLAVLCGIGLVATGLAAYSLPLGIAGLALATLVWSLGETVGSPTMIAYPARAAPPQLTGRYLGASQAVFGVGMAVGPGLGVALWEGLHGGAWAVFGAAGVVAAAAVAAGMREKSPMTAAGGTRP